VSLSVEHIPGKEYTFDVNFPEEGLNYRIDFKGETLRVNYLEAACDRFSYKDLLTCHFRLGKHDIFILFCQPSMDAKETVKFIIDGKPVYYEIPGELTVWLEDSGEVASLHSGDDPGQLTITPKEAFILAAFNTKHNHKLADSRKKTLRKSGIPVPDKVLVEKEAGTLIISWPWYDSIFHKDLIGGLILVLMSMAAWFLLPRLVVNSNDIIVCPLIFLVPGLIFLIVSFDQHKVVVKDRDVEVYRSSLGFRTIRKVNLDDVEKFEQHKETTRKGTPYSQLCALKKSGEHKIIMSYESDEIFAYLESELNLVLHRSERQPPQQGGT
jgi:hypothetical protein